MNPELLKYYKALQLFFRERMGKIKDGDSIYLYDRIITIGEYHNTGDRLMGAGCGCCSDFIASDEYENALRIPRTIDDSSEEERKRSLWGMVDWDLFHLGYAPNGLIKLVSENFTVQANPTEAILDALCAQEGVKI